MLFRVVSGVGRGKAVLYGVVIVEEEATVLGVNLGTSHCNQILCCVVVQERCTFPKLLWGAFVMCAYV